jgi:uncharacterized membrane protein YqjE
MSTTKGGLLVSLKSLAGTLIEIARTRLELLSNDLEEDRLRMMRLLFVSVFMLFFFLVGVLLLTLLIIMAFWETYRLLAIGLIALTFLTIATGLAIYLLREIKRKPRLFSASLAELMVDRSLLESDE